MSAIRPAAAGGGGDLAPDLAQFAQGARGQNRVEHELRQKTAGHAVREHIMRAEPKHRDNAREDQKYDNDREGRAGQGGVAGGAIGFLDGGAKAAAGRWLGAKGLHDPDGREIFRGIGAGLRERILRRARPLAHQAAGGDKRQHDNREWQ